MDAEANETKFCNNCKRDISSANFVMHEMHCRRHIVLCEHCEEPVPRSEIEQHFNELHAKLPCEKCKQNISKDKMERHMSSECERRPVLCEYCELSFPKNEFDSHTDFCGSRTECCPLCQQYVMLRDMLRHENSGCTYPPRKPTPPLQPPAQAPYLDPFSMLDMHQLLGGNDLDGPRVLPELSSNRLRGFETNEEHRPNRGEGEGARKNLASKNGTRGSRREPVRKKTDVNVQRANNLSNPARAFDLPPDMDYDTLLALQLAHDDWLQDDQIETDAISSGYSNVETTQAACPMWSRNAAGIEQFVGDNRDHEDGGDATIPCEFCEVEVPLESYMDHVDHCSMSSNGQNGAVPEDLNNEVLQTSMADRPSIPHINNLGTPSSMPRHQDFQPEFEEQFMLPCEFCEEMFPSEIIIQHQSVCQANGMATPRVITPASSQQRNVSHKPPASFRPNLLSSRANGQQAEQSLLDFVDDLDEHHFADDSDEQRVPVSSSNKYSTPVDRFDDAMARPPRRSSRPIVLDDSLEHQASGGSRFDTARHAKRENTSAQRARARLNQLLQEDGDNTISVSGASGVRAARPANADKKSNVDSRSVMRQLDATRAKPNKNRPNGSQASRRLPVDNNISRNNSSSSNGASQTSTSGARNRQRADHVFSPELRLKPDHNPRPRKQ